MERLVSFGRGFNSRHLHQLLTNTTECGILICPHLDKEEYDQNQSIFNMSFMSNTCKLFKPNPAKQGRAKIVSGKLALRKRRYNQPLLRNGKIRRHRICAIGNIIYRGSVRQSCQSVV